MTDTAQTIAITRNGRGDLWCFNSVEEATRHPLIQYGDAVLSGPSCVRRMFVGEDLNDFLARLGDDMLRGNVMSDVCKAEDHAGLKRAHDRHEEAIWQAIQRTAQQVPECAEEVFTLVVHDRDHYNDGLREKDHHMSETKAPENKTERAPKHDPAAKLEWLKDKEGNVFGPKNNAKRAGTKSAERFAKYSAAKTVEEFTKLGGSAADLTNDIDKAFVRIAA